MEASLASIILGIALALNSHAAEKIEGAFGLKLGEPFQHKNPSVSKFGFNEGFEFTPDKPNSAFSMYLVFVTPESNLIYQIVAIGTAPDYPSNEYMVKKTRAIIGRKYEDAPSRNETVTQDSRSVSVIGRQERGSPSSPE